MVEFIVKSGEKTRELNINLPEREVKQASFDEEKELTTMGSDNNEYGEEGTIQGVLISKLDDNTVIPLTGVKVNITMPNGQTHTSNPVGSSGVWQKFITLTKENGVDFGVHKIKAQVPDFEYEYGDNLYLMKGAKIEFESAYIGIKAREPSIIITFVDAYRNEVNTIDYYSEICIIANVAIINPLDGKPLPLYTGKHEIYVDIVIGNKIIRKRLDGNGEASTGLIKVNKENGFSHTEKANIKVVFLETKVDKDIRIT